MRKDSKIVLFFEAIGYVLVFLAIQLLMQYAVGKVEASLSARSLSDGTAAAVLEGHALSTTAIIVSSVLSSLITLCLFFRLKWALWSRTYLASRPWDQLLWVAVLTFGTIIPTMWLQELLQVEMPEAVEQMFQELMTSPSGYVVVGIFAPLAEEVVFRGAFLRLLLKVYNGRLHWIAIALSAACFGLIHGNDAQFVHAFLIGLLLGWFFWRTKSIVPGVVFHWMNNSIAYVVGNLRPDLADKSLADICGGESQVYLYRGFSLLILLPSLYQIATRLPRHTD